jgi:hypothetical protein
MAWNIIAIRKKNEIASFGSNKLTSILNIIKHRQEGNETEIIFDFNKIDKRFTDLAYPRFFDYIGGQ